jgi:hypothetical protein
MAALEFVSVMGEQRTGIVRNAQGLNPDTLHDTAAGMQNLMQAAQLRMRLIARVFAETGLKDLYLGIHAMLREHAHTGEAQFGKDWVPVDCSQWRERSQMAINVGLGSAGRVQELGAMQMITGLQEKIVELQGGASGPIVTMGNIHNAVAKLAQKAGELDPDQFFSDPAQSPDQGPPPNPAMAKTQADAQQAQAELQQKAQQEQAELQARNAIDEGKLRLGFMDAHDKDERERLALQQEQAREMARLQNEREVKAAELEIKRQDVLTRGEIEKAKIAASIEIALITSKRTEDAAMIRAQAEASRASVDMLMQAREHEHEADQAELAQAAAADADTGASDGD